MRFLADENFPLDAVEALRADGHDVVWIRTEAPGLADPDVLARAVSEERVLLTFDKDFGELAFRVGLPATSGVILFRLSPSPVSEMVDVVTTAIRGRQDWPGNFAVVTEDRVRMRLLPGV